MPPRKVKPTAPTVASGPGATRAALDATTPSASRLERAAVHSEDLPPGTKLGKYQIRRLLGRGGMGAVYEAMDVTLNRKVALKILPAAFAADEQSLKRFIREAQLAARLNHPNAVAVYDVGKKLTTYYIAMELVPGASIEQLLAAKQKLDWREATRVIADACRALSAAHEAGLIHRDIKPGNILRADSGVVKLSDFGLAKPTATARSGLTLTQQDMMLGTPLYMSPEQCENKTLDARSDIYSLGATYFALLTGSPPYCTGTALQILYAHCHAAVPDVRELAKDAPAGCSTIIRRAMAKSPAERYTTARDMLADLEALLAGNAVSEEPNGLAVALASLEPRHAEEPALARLPMAPARPGAREADNRKPLIFAGVAVAALLVVGLLAVVLATQLGDEEELKPTAAAVTPAPGPAVSATPTPSPIVTPSPEPAPPPAAPATLEPEPIVTAAPIVASEPLPAPTQTPTTAPAPMQAELPAPAAPEAPPPPPPAVPVASADGPPAELSLPSDAAQRDPFAVKYTQLRNKAIAEWNSDNQTTRRRFAQALILWHDHFAQDDVPLRQMLAKDAIEVADHLAPGISSVQPRVRPTGMPLPPTDRPPPPSGDRRGGGRQPPKGRPSR